MFEHNHAGVGFLQDQTKVLKEQHIPRESNEFA
jgi:hypothetical protein